MASRTLAVDLSGITYSLARTGDLASNLPATTTVAANIATLVADGASPTQAHVTTLNGNWTTYLAALSAAITAASHDLSVVFNDSTLDTVDKKVQAVALIHKALGLPGA